MRKAMHVARATRRSWRALPIVAMAAAMAIAVACGETETVVQTVVVEKSVPGETVVQTVVVEREVVVEKEVPKEIQVVVTATAEPAMMEAAFRFPWQPEARRDPDRPSSVPAQQARDRKRSIAHLLGILRTTDVGAALWSAKFEPRRKHLHRGGCGILGSCRRH